MLIKIFFLFRWSSNISSYGRQISENFGVDILLKYVTWAILWLFCTFLLGSLYRHPVENPYLLLGTIREEIL